MNSNTNTEEVSFRTQTKLPVTAVLVHEFKNEISKHHFLQDINNNENNNNNDNNNIIEDIQTSFSVNVSLNSCNDEPTITLPADTNDLDENDLIEELIEELDIIEEVDDEQYYTHHLHHNNANAGDLEYDEVSDNENNYLMPNLNITFECKYCYKWKNSSTEYFVTQHELLSHITSMHHSEQPYNCPYCSENFMDAASRTTHLKNEHSQKVYECETCGKKYADKFNLKNHIEKYHSGTDFDCTLCGKSFCSSKSLNYHMKWHNPKEQLKCSYCDRLFINQRHLKCHEETHTGFRSQEVCSFCGKSKYNSIIFKSYTLIVLPNL